ncbi:MAG: AI-2E family transporter [Verrucomicrobiota bacterium]
MTAAPFSPRRNTGLKFLLSMACLVLVLGGLKVAAEFFIPILLGLFLAVLSLPLTNWLEVRRVPRLIAVFCAVAVDLMVVSLLVFVTITIMPDFQASAAKYETEAREQVMRNAVALQDWVDGTFGPVQDWVAGNIGEGELADSPEKVLDLQSVAEQILSLDSLISVVAWVNQVNIVQTMISLVTKTFFAFIIMIFFLAEAQQFAGKIERMVEARGPNFRRFSRAGRELQQYLGIKTLASLATGVLAGLVCVLFGVEFALLWALIAFFFNFVPTVGSLVAAIPPILVAMLQLGFWPSVLIAICYLAINLVIGTFVEPTMLGHEFGISTVVVIISVLFWGWLWGPVGMFLAVPLTMVLKMMLEGSDDFRWLAVAMSKNQEAGLRALLEEEEEEDNPLDGPLTVSATESIEG